MREFIEPRWGMIYRYSYDALQRWGADHGRSPLCIARYWVNDGWDISPLATEGEFPIAEQSQG